MTPIASSAAEAVAHVFRVGPPPVDVERLARQLGVDEIVRAPLVEDGRLERRRGSTRIRLRNDISHQRMRFTIAHELGHLLLSDPASDLVARRRHRRGSRGTLL